MSGRKRICGSWVPILHMKNPTLRQKLRNFRFCVLRGHIWRHPVPTSHFLCTCGTQLFLRGLAAVGSEVNDTYLHLYVMRYSEVCGGKNALSLFNKSTIVAFFCFFGGKTGGKWIQEGKQFPLVWQQIPYSERQRKVFAVEAAYLLTRKKTPERGEENREQKKRYQTGGNCLFLG